MKFLLWTIAAIAIAVGLVAAAVRSSAGYLQIVWPPHRIELSLVMAIVLLAAAFALAYVSVRLIAAMVSMPQQVREYREARRSRKAHEAITEALHEFFSGRFARAEKAAKNAMALGEQPGLSAMLAARAAHELRAFDRRDAYLAQGAMHLPSGDIMKVITEAELLLEQRRAADALAVLQTQPQKHTAGLRLELKALQLAKEWEKSLAVIDQLERRNVFDGEQAARLRHHALAEHLKRRASDVAALDEAWRKVPEVQRRDTAVARAAAEGYVTLNTSAAGARAAEIIARSLDQTWDSDLAALYADCAGEDTVQQIERAERWLSTHSHDAALLLTLARLCARQGLWGKAQNYVDASIAIEPTYPAHLAAAQLHGELGKPENVQRHTRAALDLALAKLRERDGR
ncbi:MAG: heme biosynthesis HemY N-terminal domain-containing protein [Burkholderiales bacterium]